MTLYLPHHMGEVAAQRPEGGGAGALVESSVHLRTMQCLEDGLDDGVGPGQRIAVPESQNAKAAGPKEGIAMGIVGRLGDVLAAVEFHHDRGLQSDEIADVPADRPLPAELEAPELPSPQPLPDQAFGFRGVVAKLAGKVVHVSLDDVRRANLWQRYNHRLPSPSRPPPYDGGGERLFTSPE